MIRAVSFDADQTLWDFEGAERGGLGASLVLLAERLPAVAGRLAVDDLIAARAALKPVAAKELWSLERLRRASFSHALAAVDVDDHRLADDLAERYFDARLDHLRVFDDTVPALDALAHVLVGIATNGSAAARLDRIGLAGRFGFCVMANDVGVGKPDPAFFDAVLAAAGCTRGELVHVGDSFEDDVVGAVGAGIVTVWLNRDAAARPAASPAPDHEIRSLAELPAILAGR